MPSVPPPSDSPDPSPESAGERPSERPRSVRPSGVPPAGAMKRPRYLLVALIVTLVFGAGCWTEGCGRLAFYRGEQDQSQALNAAIKSDADRARAEALYRRFTEVADAARGRAIPMAAAIFVLGAALLALASRGLAGKTNTRNALLQVTTAQAIVVVLAYFVTRDIRNAELDWEMERTLIHQRETLPADQYEQVVPMMQSMRHWVVRRRAVSSAAVDAAARKDAERASGPRAERPRRSR